MHGMLKNALLPHYCCSCGKIGEVLCEYCKYDIISDISAQCFACLRPTARYGEVCQSCKTYYSMGWFIGGHRSVLRELIVRYKFKRVKASSSLFVSLLNECLPQLPPDTLVACVPTVRDHVRVRGYDHAELVAKGFAKQRRLAYHNPLRRAVNTQQRGAVRSVRLAQARQAFVGAKAKPCRYLLIDDVSTTGATINFAAKALLDAGATDVWVATITREPLD